MNRTDTILKKRLIRQIIVPAIFSVALLWVAYLLVSPTVKRLIIGERQQMVREMVTSVNNVLDGYNDRIKHGELTLSEAQTIAINTIKNQRYGKNHGNYFWIQDYEGHLIYHPFIESSSSANPKIASSIRLIAIRISQMVKKQNEGFISYDWYTLQNNKRESKKETFAKGYEPWKWVVCTGFMLIDIDDDLQQLTNKVLLVLFLFLGTMLLTLALVLFRNYQNLKKIMLRDADLKKSEARFRGFVSQMDNGIMIFEGEKPVFANQHFSHIFEIKEDAVWQFNLEDYLPGWERERVRIIMNTPAESKNLELEMWLHLESQVEKYVNVQYNYDAESTYKYMVVKDLTEQKQSLTMIDILSENLAKSPDSVLITDLNGNIEYANPGFEKITGYAFHEVKGQNPRILKSEKMSPRIYEDLWKTITNGEIWKGEMLNKKKDGSFFWESTIIFPIRNRNNEIIKYSSIKTDISHGKLIEQELVVAKDKAQENDRFKTAFLHNVSHEVRTPLNAIYGLTQLLKSDFEANETVFSYLKLMDQNCQILLNLFEDILDVSGIESKSITLYKEDVPLKSLLLKIVSKYNTQITITGSKQVEIIVDEDSNFETLVLYTDRKRITQVFDKLISNAVKFTNVGHIKISYDIYPENITFYITDTGVGIPDREKDMIFNSFSHGSHVFLSLHKGVGLGLNIAKMLVEMLGGHLTFCSDEGKGTTFVFTFPCTDLKNYALEGISVDAFNQTVTGKTILIAEDNDENFLYLEAILTPDNQIVRAITGVEAVQLVEEGNFQPDIILMDILMPDMDGIAASRIIREVLQTTPIVALAAMGMSLSDTEKRLFDDVLSKPVSAKALVEKILEVLKRNQK